MKSAEISNFKASIIGIAVVKNNFLVCKVSLQYITFGGKEVCHYYSKAKIYKFDSMWQVSKLK